MVTRTQVKANVTRLLLCSGGNEETSIHAHQPTTDTSEQTFHVISLLCRPTCLDKTPWPILD